MLKKLVCTVLIFAIISVFGITAFADPTPGPAVTPAATPFTTPSPKAKAADNDLAEVLSKVSDETGETLVDITRPEEDTDSTYKRSYVISGISDDYTDITVVLQVYDDASESYVDMENTDGESRWSVGSFGFSKEIELKEGPNQIRILAYRTSQLNGLKPENVQVNKFTITLLKPGVKDVFNKVVEFTTEILKKTGLKQ